MATIDVEKAGKTIFSTQINEKVIERVSVDSNNILIPYSFYSYIDECIFSRHKIKLCDCNRILIYGIYGKNYSAEHPLKFENLYLKEL